MNRLSRKKTRICIILTGVFIGIMVLSTLLQSRAIWGIGVLVGLCWGFLLDQTSRCPHCGRFFPGIILVKAPCRLLQVLREADGL